MTNLNDYESLNVSYDDIRELYDLYDDVLDEIRAIFGAFLPITHVANLPSANNGAAIFCSFLLLIKPPLEAIRV